MLWGVFLSQNMYAMTVLFSRQLIIAECLSKLKKISNMYIFYIYTDPGYSWKLKNTQFYLYYFGYVTCFELKFYLFKQNFLIIQKLFFFVIEGFFLDWHYISDMYVTCTMYIHVHTGNGNIHVFPNAWNSVEIVLK